MRLFLVLLSVVVALALWVWATGPGTSLLVAAGGWIFCAVVGRVTYVLLKPKVPYEDDPPQAPPGATPPPRPRHRHRHRP